MRKAVMSKMEEKAELNSNNQSAGGGIARKFQFFFRNWDTKIMVYVMAIVILIAVIAATVAWYAYYRIVSAKNIGVASASCESLKVALESGGDDVAELEAKGQSVLVDLNIPYFHNVESYIENGKTKSKLAPGVYGEITLYLTSLTKEINHYRIIPITLLTYDDGSRDQVDGNGNLVPAATPGAEVLRKLVQGHVLFYRERTSSIVGGRQEYTYSGQILQEKSGALEGELVFDSQRSVGEETQVTIYWYWPYEYGDISSETQAKIKQQSDSSTEGLDWDMFFFDPNADKGLSVIDDMTLLYDYADTKIGSSVRDIKIQLRVDGYYEEQ